MGHGLGWRRTGGARGQRLGRPPALTPDQVRRAPALLTRPDESVSSIARLLGVSRSTLYYHVPKLRAGPAFKGESGPAGAVRARRRSRPPWRRVWRAAGSERGDCLFLSGDRRIFQQVQRRTMGAS
ncbi:helix-turn-helix domain-containing protein [Actinomadura syzygii]|nr:helix-turn-helix domain-containing protein [Actinomadura syzygii]